jgi:hypothetical protein
MTELIFSVKISTLLSVNIYELRDDRRRRGRTWLLVGVNKITVMSVKVRVKFTLEQATKSQKGVNVCKTFSVARKHA